MCKGIGNCISRNEKQVCEWQRWGWMRLLENIFCVDVKNGRLISLHIRQLRRIHPKVRNSKDLRITCKDNGSHQDYNNFCKMTLPLCMSVLTVACSLLNHIALYLRRFVRKYSMDVETGEGVVGRFLSTLTNT